MRHSAPAAAFTAAALFLSATTFSPAPALAAPRKTEAAGAAAAPAATPKSDNPVVASVNGDPIRLDRVRAAAQSLPDEMRGMPPQMLFPMIVNQLVDQKALLIEAQREGLAKDPEAQRAMQAASDQALQNVYLQRTVGPQINRRRDQGTLRAGLCRQARPEGGACAPHPGFRREDGRRHHQAAQGGRRLRHAGQGGFHRQGLGRHRRRRPRLVQAGRHAAGVLGRRLLDEQGPDLRQAGAYPLWLARDPGARHAHLDAAGPSTPCATRSARR